MVRLLAVLMLLSLSVKADEFTDEANIKWYYNVEDGKALIYGSANATGAVNIPSHVNGIEVKKVSDSGFQRLGGPIFGNFNLSVTSVTLPNSVTSIGNMAFEFCVNLKSVSIPNSVTSIGTNAFSFCSKLTSLKIPNGVTSIGQNTFQYCYDLTNIVIPNTVVSIGNYAFSSCSSLTNIFIPNSVTSIGQYAFRYCSSLTNIVIPNSVASIGNYAFSDCFSLNEVYLPLRFRNNFTPFGLSSNQVQIFLSPSDLNVIESNSESSGIAAVTNSPSNYGLYNLAQYYGNFTAGQQSVLQNPNTHNLYTTNQISAMAIGDLVLTRTNNGSFVLNYDIEQSEDLVNWTPYQGFAMPLTNLPTNKAFVRIKAKQ